MAVGKRVLAMLTHILPLAETAVLTSIGDASLRTLFACLRMFHDLPLYGGVRVPDLSGDFLEALAGTQRVLYFHALGQGKMSHVILPLVGFPDPCTIKRTGPPRGGPCRGSETNIALARVNATPPDCKIECTPYRL